MKKILSSLFLFSFLVSTLLVAQQREHPCLLLSKNGVKEIKKNLSKQKLFDQSLVDIKKQLDEVVDQPINVPIPKDAGGGYTHEQHKKNYLDMYHAGILYQLYKDEKYARFVKNMLIEYGKLYPNLALHPVVKSNYRGKLFWQGLNECVWLVHTAQAYDCIYDYLKPEERSLFESNIFRPMVKFFVEDNVATFNKMHNHATWAIAGVGMIGYVMGDKDMVDKALYGSDKSGKYGFMKQLNELFSPDGYFTEGPYYQRYSLQPFIVFAQAIQQNQPELKIFEYRDGILKKAVTTLLQLAYTDGQFFHLNDALDKTWHSSELVYGVDIVYNYTKDARLLSIAKEQNRVILSDAGMAVAKALEAKQEKPFEFRPMLLRDGATGENGTIGILRMGSDKDQTCLVMKSTSHGLSHGHYDKLSFSYYDNGKEIIQDYGAARYLNIEPKNGGHYLPENKTWAMQTIAHNTLVVDETSHFKGLIAVSSKYSPKHYYFTATDKVQLVSAKDENAYPGVKMHRSMLMINNPLFEKPLIIDIFRVESKQQHTYDFPFYFLGQLIKTNFDYKAYTDERFKFGENYGYQYLWVEAKGNITKEMAAITWLNGNRFYTISTLADADTELYLNRIGASDPSFNLRPEPCFIVRENGKENHTFISVIEAHGDFNPRLEYTRGYKSNIVNIRKIVDAKEYTLIEITTDKGQLIIGLANNNIDVKATHKVDEYSWQGVYTIIQK
jgi:hypothetical protein